MTTRLISKKMLAVAVASACTIGAVSTTVASPNLAELKLAGKAQKQENVRYIVKFKDQSDRAMSRSAATQGVSVAEARLMANTRTLSNYGAKMASNLSSVNAASVELNSAQVKALRSDPKVEYVEIDPKRYLIENVKRSFESSQVPQPQAETAPYGVALVQADQVSDAFTGNMSVCVTDTGYEGDHEDLVPYTSPLMTGDDNDGLGNDTGNWWEPGHAHGTHVAGTIGALGGNGTGVTSVNPSGLLKMHHVKIFNNAGSWAYGSDVVRAIEQCQAAGSNIISMSIGGGAPSEAERQAFEIANDAGMLHIAAAGNSANSTLSYPASYDEVMSVGALDSSKQIAYFSQYNEQVEISAPGVNVESTVLDNGYASYNGTSMATPHVSGVAALVWSHYPECTPAQIRTALIASAEDLGATGRDNYYGHGLVQAKDMYDALADGCEVEPPPPPPPPVVGVLEKGVPVTGLSGTASSKQRWTFDVPAGVTDVTFSMSGGIGDADLYTKFGSEATMSSYDCRPFAWGNNETCVSDDNDGTFYVMINGYSNYSGVTLVADYDDGTAPPPPDGDSYTNDNDYPIVDNATVTSDIDVDGTGDAGVIAVSVDIKHTWIQDLTLSLVAPSGDVVVLRERSGGSADDILETYDVDATGQERNGIWTLQVTDSASWDTGYIDSWTITFP